jgi:membrane-bound serine protease (ClpP class)
MNALRIMRLFLICLTVCCGFFSYADTFSTVKPVSLTENVIASPNFEQRLQDRVKFNPDGENTIGHIFIGDRSTQISDATWLYVKVALDYYKKTRPAFIILELNTPGGEVFAAEKISDALMAFDTQENIPVIAFINNWAMSAGAMLSFSCRFIAVTKDASMGAAEPITASSTGEMQTASEKVNSALRADFANRANFFGRDPALAEAMVDKDVIIVLREGKILRLNSETQLVTKEPNPDVIISPKGKLLTLTAEQLMQFGVADVMVLPTKLEAVTDAEKLSGKWPAKKSLLFQIPYLSKIPNAIIDEYQMDWKTRFFVLLASPMVSSILMLGLMIGFYVEMSSPGFGVAAIIGLLCLFLMTLSYLSLDIANWLEVILLVSVLLIILVDLFLLPTFGLLGSIGLIMALAGLFGMLLPGLGSVDFNYDTQTFNAAGLALLERLAWFCATIVVGFLIILVLARYMTPSLAKWSRLVLSGGEQDVSEGYVAGVDSKSLPAVGAKGEVISTLRPAGKVMIDNVIYDAISNGVFIERGEPIEVVQLDGSVIVVDIVAKRF